MYKLSSSWLIHFSIRSGVTIFTFSRSFYFHFFSVTKREEKASSTEIDTMVTAPPLKSARERRQSKPVYLLGGEDCAHRAGLQLGQIEKLERIGRLISRPTDLRRNADLIV